MAENNVLTLLSDLKAKRITPDALTPLDKRLVIIHLLEEMKYTHAQIAIWVGLTTKRVDQINVERKRNCAGIVKGLDVQSLIGQYVQIATKSRQKMAEQEDWHGVWKVTREMMQDLQELGILKKVPTELNISLTDRAEEWEKMFGIKITRNDPIEITTDAPETSEGINITKHTEGLRQCQQ